MQLRFRFRPSQNVSFGGGFVSAENEKYGFGRSLLVPLYQQSHQSEVTVSSVMAEQSLLAVGPTFTRQRFTTNLSNVMTISFQSVTFKNLVGAAAMCCHLPNN